MLFFSCSGEEHVVHRGPRDLSEEEHYPGNGHDHYAQYDHKAFLGKEQAERLDQLSPAEAKRRLGLVYFMKQASSYLILL